MSEATETRSPFHAGEQAVQTRVGVRERAESLGSRTIRTFMPEQHQEFYQALPYLLVGHVDELGRPWASWLSQPDITIETERNFSLEVEAVHPEDPLQGTIERNGMIGVLGVDLSNRRRNRMSAMLTGIKEGRLNAEVRQAFGNCPQYIQTREITKRSSPAERNQAGSESRTAFSAADKKLIEQSDAFFVASYFEDGTNGDETGADVSHRGGQPGFVRVDNEKKLTIPEFSGNNHFNTLGNIYSNGKAGLLFVDFESGDLLMLTGTAEILWNSEDVTHFEGAQRMWTFELEASIRLKSALGLQFLFQQFSPNSLLAGNWAGAEAAKAAEAQKQAWLPYRVERTIDELPDVKSFELVPPKGFEPQFEAGQFLTIKVQIDGVDQVRTYTVSSSPSDKALRISVKRDGLVSNYLHDHLKAQSVIDARAPNGEFFLNPEKAGVFVAAGIGITPMLSMIREGLFRSVKYREQNEMVLFYQVKNEAQLAFLDELKSLEDLMGGLFRVVKVFSKPSTTTSDEMDYEGYLNRDIFNAELRLNDYQFYLCGPGGFTQSIYDEIRALGVNDANISAEAFGPASLKRDVESQTVVVESADSAVVEFVPSNVEQGWTPKDGNLLDFAEAHGLAPTSGCRAGHCGSCATRVLSGDVVYEQNTTYPVPQGEALLCCAVPAKSAESTPLKLDL